MNNDFISIYINALMYNRIFKTQPPIIFEPVEVCKYDPYSFRVSAWAEYQKRYVSITYL